MVNGLLEPDAVKVASPVLRGERGGNAPDLPDLKKFGKTGIDV